MHHKSSSSSSTMEYLASNTTRAKRRKLTQVQSSEMTTDSDNVPCLACRCLTIDHRPLVDQAFLGKDTNDSQSPFKDIEVPFHLEDHLPDLPALQTSSENGCTMCGELRASLTKHPSFQSLSKLRSPSQSALEIRLQASIQCEPNWRARSLTFQADLVSGSTASDHKTSPQLVYEIFTGENTMDTPVHRSLPSTEALSSHNVLQVRSWINNCQQNHVNCPRKRWSLLPTRVIDVRANDPVLVVGTGKQGEYAALSHCWGLSEDNPYDQQYTTNSDTIGSHLEGMPMAELPKTFQDAVIVTRELGLQYLWIDSLCILQDSKVEMKQEIQLMASVYGNATITISATNASNSRSGFLARDPLPKPAVTLPFSQSDGSLTGSLHLYRLELQRTWDMDVENSEWNQRAWTFQERILSSRVLHFAKNKLYFECCSGDTDEDGSLSRRPIYDPSFTGDSTLLARLLGYFQHFSRQAGLELNQIYKSYYELAAAYSRRDLTFHRDREAAFSAITDQFQSMLMSNNVGGTWINDMSFGLLWQCKQDKWWRNEVSQSRTENETSLQSENFLPPAWSWYSTKGEVYWPKRPSISQNALYKPEDLLRYLEPSEIGLGRLQVLSYITSGYHEYDASHKRGKINVEGKYFCYPEFDNLQAAETSGVVWILRLPSPNLERCTYDHGLLLEAQEPEGCFKRVGTFRLGGLMKRSRKGNWVKIRGVEELKWVTLV